MWWDFAPDEFLSNSMWIYCKWFLAPGVFLTIMVSGTRYNFTKRGKFLAPDVIISSNVDICWHPMYSYQLSTLSGVYLAINRRSVMSKSSSLSWFMSFPFNLSSIGLRSDQINSRPAAFVIPDQQVSFPVAPLTDCVPSSTNFNKKNHSNYKIGLVWSSWSRWISDVLGQILSCLLSLVCPHSLSCILPVFSTIFHLSVFI